MDIDKHDMQILATKISNILIESSSNLLKKYPKSSFAIASLFFFYIFFPTFLWFLINTIPFIILIGAIIIKTYISINNEGRVIEKHENDNKRKVESTDDDDEDNKKYNTKHARSVRRRKSKIIFAETSRENSIQEKEAIASTNFIYDVVDKRPLAEEAPKEIREVEANVMNDRVGSASSEVSQHFLSQFNSILRSQTFGGDGIDAEGVSSEKSKDEDDDSRGEDQKNVAAIGLAEIERNKRLEFLIARRRERKIMTLQARKTMNNMGGNGSPNGSPREMMYYVTIPKMNPLSPRHSQHTPGSAPPALLPARNPFDLPYELHEDKPVLTEDSFHQEFLGTHPKDVLYCRHKSFSSGGIVPGDMIHTLHQLSLHNNHGADQEVSELHENTECLSGENVGKEVEQEQSLEAECDDKVVNPDKNIPDPGSEQSSDLDDFSHEDIENEGKTKSVIVEDYDGGVSSSSSSDENERIDRLDREKLFRSLSSLDPRNMNIQRGGGCIDGILFDNGTYKTKEAAGPFNYPHHNPRQASTISIASDLQVEVSELSSPRILSDTNSSSTDEVSSLCEEIPDCEELWKPSSQLSKGEENESRSRDLGQFSEEDTIGVGFSRIEESEIPAERVIEQDPSDIQPSSVSESKVPGDDDYIDYIERIVHEQPNISCPNSSHDFKHKNLRSQEDNQLAGTSTTDHIFNTDLQNPKVPSLHTTNPTDKSDIRMSSPNPEVHNTNEERTIQEIGNQNKESHSHESDEVIGNLRSPEKFIAEVEHPIEAKDETEKKILVGENVIHNEDTSHNVDDEAPSPHNTVNNKIPEELHNSASGFDSEEYLKATVIDGSTGESSQPTFTREVEGMPEEMQQHAEIQDSRSTEGNYILESTTDTEDEASSIAIANSEPTHFVIQPNEVPPVPESLTEQAPTALSTSSSPKSVLNQSFSADQVQMENQPFGGESTSSNSISPRAQNVAPLAEDLTTHQSHESIERIQEPSNSQLVSTEEATSTSGSISNHEMDLDLADHGQKETSETLSMSNNSTNQVTSLSDHEMDSDSADQGQKETSETSSVSNNSTNQETSLSNHELNSDAADHGQKETSETSSVSNNSTNQETSLSNHEMDSDSADQGQKETSKTSSVSNNSTNQETSLSNHELNLDAADHGQKETSETSSVSNNSTNQETSLSNHELNSDAADHGQKETSETSSVSNNSTNQETSLSNHEMDSDSADQGQKETSETSSVSNNLTNHETSLSNHELNSDAADHGQKETSETSYVSNNSTNQETSLSNHEMDSDSADHGQKETSKTSFVSNNSTNQETSNNTIPTNGEETETTDREGRL